MNRLRMTLLLAALITIAAFQFTAAQSSDSAPADDLLTEAKLTKVKAELHNLQVAIERWGLYHVTADGESCYPHSLSQLLLPMPDGYQHVKPGFYHNPFAPGADDELNAMQVPFGWSEQAVGNFSYLTQYNDAGDVVAYVLVVYGPPTATSTISITTDDQPDGIIATMTSSNVDHQTPQECYDNGRLVVLDWRLAE